MDRNSVERLVKDAPRERQPGVPQPLLTPALDAVPLPLIGFDSEARVVLWNAAAASLFGWSAGEVVGRSPEEGSGGGARGGARDPEREEAVRTFLSRAWGRLPATVRKGEVRERGVGAAWGIEGVLPTRDGGQIEVAVCAGPLPDEFGRESGTLVQLVDLRERRRAERERAVVQDHLHRLQKIDAIGRLSGGVAHDFNNLLMAIKGNAELAALDLPEDSPALEDLAEIRRAAGRAAELTRQLLAFSQKQVFRPVRMDLNAHIVQAQHRLREELGKDLELDLDPGAGTVELDPAQLDEIFANLLRNARDAVAAGGEVTVATRAVDLGPEHSRELLYDVPAGPYVNLLVRDTGSGMQETTREHAFEPFFSTKERGKAPGLGLSTVYGIVKQSGGFIELRSAPGSGTEVSILFPRYSGGEGPAAAGAVRSRSTRGDETVLLVEDESAILALTRRVLARNGYRVLEAGSGRDALRVADAHPGPIHLLVTDVVMPGMTGPELALELRERRPETRVLYMSGYNQEVVTERGILRPGTALLAKPFSPSAFLHRVRETLGDDEPAT